MQQNALNLCGAGGSSLANRQKKSEGLSGVGVERLFQQFQPLVQSAVSTYGKYLSNTQNEDIESVANLGLLEAIHSYDPKKAKTQRFAGWAKMYVLNSVRKFVYANSNMIKGSSYSGAIKMFWLLPTICQSLNLNDSDVERVAKDYNVTVDEVLAALQLLKSNTEFCDMDTPGDKQKDLLEFSADLKSVSKKFPMPVQEMMQDVMCNPDRSHQEIGEGLGKSGEWVRLKLKEVHEAFRTR